MKKLRYTDSQILDALKRVEAVTAVQDLCRELSASAAPRSTSGEPSTAAWIHDDGSDERARRIEPTAQAYVRRRTAESRDFPHSIPSYARQCTACNLALSVNTNRIFA